MKSYLSSFLTNFSKIYQVPYYLLKKYKSSENKKTNNFPTIKDEGFTILDELLIPKEEEDDDEFLILEKEDILKDVIKYFLNDIKPSYKHLSNLLKEKDDNTLLNKFLDYQNMERGYYFNKFSLYKYFLFEDKINFNLNKLIEENKAKTDEFRYYSLFFSFGINSEKLYNFYYELFANVNKQFGYNCNFQETLLNLKQLNKSSEWIIIIPCYLFPLLINELNRMPHIRYILLHCHGYHFHKEKYLKSFNKYKGVFISHQKLLILLKNINKKYKLPQFNYDFEEKKLNQAFKIPKENENIIENENMDFKDIFKKIYSNESSLISKDCYNKYNFKANSNIESKIKNDLRNFYENNYFFFDYSSNFFNTINQLILKIYFYYKNIDFQKLKKNLKYKFYVDFIISKNNISEKEQIELCKEFIPKLYLVCYYFHSYPYYYPFKMEKKEVLECQKYSKLDYQNKKKELFFKLGTLINDCYKKIVNNECIINEKLTNDFHKLLLKIDIAYSDDENTDYHQELEYNTDFDLGIENFVLLLDTQSQKQLDIVNCLTTDQRFINLNIYHCLFSYNTKKFLPKDEDRIAKWSEGIKIKKILIIYDTEDFLELIKSINITGFEIEFLCKEDLDDFLIKRETTEYGLRIMKYYVITDINIADELYNTFNFYKSLYGLTFIFIIYYYSNSLISKTIGRKLNSICVNSKETIYEYFDDIKNKFKYYSALIIDILSTIQESIEKDKILFNPINNITDEKDNGWDFRENLDSSIFEQNFIIRNSSYVLNAYAYEIYNMYKEKDLLDLFFSFYSTYFLSSCPEEHNAVEQNVKKIIYIWTCQKEEKENSFYYLMNEDLKSGKLNRIKRYLSFFYSIKYCIFNHLICTYKDEAYRGTKLDVNFIKNLKKGKIIFNPCFWACSKEKKFAKDYIITSTDGRNVLLIVKGNNNNNIDIDKEELSFYPTEKEILIIPFCSFILTEDPKLVKDKDYNYDYYEIYLEYIEEKMIDDKVINMRVKDIDILV